VRSKTTEDRFYKKEKYEASIGAFVLGIVFVFIGVLALIFMRFGINFIGLRFWGYWLFIPAFFIFIGGFRQIYVNNQYKSAVKNAIVQRNKRGTHKLEHIAKEIGIESNIVLRVLLDLRNEGFVKYMFNPDTGEIILGESVSYTPSEEFEAPGKEVEAELPTVEKSFCVFCGQKLEVDAKFCPSCGSKL